MISALVRCSPDDRLIHPIESENCEADGRSYLTIWAIQVHTECPHLQVHPRVGTLTTVLVDASTYTMGGTTIDGTRTT
jgi:hypothetical protein